MFTTASRLSRLKNIATFENNTIQHATGCVQNGVFNKHSGDVIWRPVRKNSQTVLLLPKYAYTVDFIDVQQSTPIIGEMIKNVGNGSGH